MKPCVYVFKGSSADAYNLVLDAARKQLGLPENPEIIKDSKPYLRGFPDFHFNISNSGDFVAVAFADTPIGIDIEVHRDVNLKISERYFTADEKNYVKDNISFFYVWTRKEALLKQIGVGLKEISSHGVLNNKNIKTVIKENFTLSVCLENERDFEFIYKENFCGRP